MIKAEINVRIDGENIVLHIDKEGFGCCSIPLTLDEAAELMIKIFGGRKYLMEVNPGSDPPNVYPSLE